MGGNAKRIDGVGLAVMKHGGIEVCRVKIGDGKGLPQLLTVWQGNAARVEARGTDVKARSGAEQRFMAAMEMALEPCYIVAETAEKPGKTPGVDWQRGCMAAVKLGTVSLVFELRWSQCR
ncbi:hypothetical protein NL676_008938 [Syzygium grande]|nr:hypothetical protein NL676_008938 [Syzygium grande]